MKEEHKIKDFLHKKKVTKTAAVATVTLAALVGNLFTGADEIIAPTDETVLTPPAVVMEIDMSEPDEDVSPDEDVEETKRGGLRARIRQRLLALPFLVRLLVVTPLWAVGAALSWAVGLLASVIGTPVMAVILSILGIFAVLLLLFVGTAKTLFPDLPLKEIVRKRNLIVIGLVAVILGIVDHVMPLYYDYWTVISIAVKLCSFALVVGLILAKIKKKLSYV